MEHIKVDSLSFSYPKKNNVLNNVSFKIDKGDFVLVFGKSGSGKSTLLKHLSLSLAPYGEKKGEVYIDNKRGEEISLKERCEKIGYVAQNVDAQIITDKVWHELVFTLENLGYDDVTMRKRMAEITGFFSISSWLDRDTSTLSGGEKQKLNLAVSMLTFPDILLLDEPTSQLDPVMRDEFIRLLKKINDEFATTIIITEHSFDGFLEYTDKCMLLEEGKIKYYDDTKNVINSIIEEENEYYDFLPDVTKMGARVLGNNEVLNVKTLKKLLLKENIPLKKKEDVLFKRSDENLIELKNVYFKYEKNQKDILKDVSLKIKKGDFMALIGPNGVGKSTLLNIIIGQLKPYKGNIAKAGKIAMLPQNPRGIFVKSSVLEDLRDIDENYMDLVRRFSLEDLIHSHPYDLSGGQIEILALIKVFLTKPDFVLLDEPTKGMDVCLKNKLAKLLVELNKNSTGVFIVSHDIEFIAKNVPLCSIMYDRDIMPFKESKKLFGENYFYTTDINKATRSIKEGIILFEEVYIDEK